MREGKERFVEKVELERNEEQEWRVMLCSQQQDQHEQRHSDRLGAWCSWGMIVQRKRNMKVGE